MPRAEDPRGSNDDVTQRCVEGKRGPKPPRARSGHVYWTVGMSPGSGRGATELPRPSSPRHSPPQRSVTARASGSPGLQHVCRRWGRPTARQRSGERIRASACPRERIAVGMAIGQASTDSQGRRARAERAGGTPTGPSGGENQGRSEEGPQGLARTRGSRSPRAPHGARWEPRLGGGRGDSRCGTVFPGAQRLG